VREQVMVLPLSLRLSSRSLSLLLLLGVASVEGRKVSLDDLPSFHAELEKLTTGRKAARAPQMKCDGGNAGCGWPIQPKAVECVNLATTRPTGSSKSTTGWQCRQLHVMSPHFKMTNVRVSCEGYESQEDLNILQGSCGVSLVIILWGLSS
jgi:hypothetical protein